MEKIYIRKKYISCVSSRYIGMIGDMEFKTLDEIINHYGKEEIISKLYEENIDEIEKINEEYLQKDYMSEMQYFHLAYKVNDRYAVSISQQIELFQLEKRFEIEGQYILPWDYANGKNM